jgi:hypothetical protein
MTYTRVNTDLPKVYKEVYYDSVNDEIYYDTEEEVIPQCSVESDT